MRAERRRKTQVGSYLISRAVTRLVRYAWLVVGWTVVTVLLGALVRATHSGAGCGRTWPACQGELLPELSGATTIEFVHRTASGLVLVLAALLAWWTFRHRPGGDPARRTSAWAFGLTVGEALIGAAIVFFEWVAEDTSLARVVAVPLHLLNTFLLLAMLTLTVWFLRGGRRLTLRGAPFQWVMAGATALIVIAGTGAVTALADTLFPSESVGSGLAAAVVSTEHFLTRLRVLHPVLALLTVSSAALATRSLRAPVLARIRPLLVLSFGQVGLGLLTIALGSPLWIRLLHLAVADAIWVTYVWFCAQTLSSSADKDSIESTGARQAKPVQR